MTKLKELESGLAIDEHALDIALRNHPDLFYKVSSEQVLAISNRDEAKYDLEQIEALIDKEIRQKAVQSKTKTTEKDIESQRKLDKRVVSANDKFFAEKLTAAQWTVLGEAYEQRSRALSKLVDLHLANYYSTNQDQKTGSSVFKTAKAQHVKEVVAGRRARVGVE
jgi:hypothetical protein